MPRDCMQSRDKGHATARSRVKEPRSGRPLECHTTSQAKNRAQNTITCTIRSLDNSNTHVTEGDELSNVSVELLLIGSHCVGNRDYDRTAAVEAPCRK
jgi:hypothetical protein